MNIKRKQTNASLFEKIRAAVHVIWHVCAILPSSGAMRSLVATLAQWHLFVCDVAQSSDVLCVADTCRDVDIAEVVLLWRRHHCVMTCCDVHACCGYVCLNVWLPLHFFWFQWFLFVFFCEVIILPNMLRSTVAMLLFSTQLSFPEPCRLLCAAFYGCSCFCLCLNNVVTITHGMVVFFYCKHVIFSCFMISMISFVYGCSCVSVFEEMFKSKLMVSMISSFIFALQFQCLLFCYWSNRFFRRSSNVVNITHGMVVVLMEHLPSLRSIVEMISFMDATFLLLFKECLRKCLWFQRFLYLSLRTMVSFCL